jgi:hypothetical protein
MSASSSMQGNTVPASGMDNTIESPGQRAPGPVTSTP